MQGLFLPSSVVIQSAITESNHMTPYREPKDYLEIT